MMSWGVNAKGARTAIPALPAIICDLERLLHVTFIPLHLHIQPGPLLDDPSGPLHSLVPPTSQRRLQEEASHGAGFPTRTKTTLS